MGMYDFAFVYVRSFYAMFAAGRRWHHRGSSLVFHTNKGRGVGACSPPFFYASVLSHNVSSHSSSRHADVDSFTHTHVCVCWPARTHISSRSRTCSASTHQRTHTNRPIVVEGDSDGPRFMMKVLLQGISVNLFRGKEVQQAYKKAIQQLPRVSLASRQTTKKKIALRKPRLKKQNSLFSSPFFLFSHPLPPPVYSSMPTCLLDI